MDPVRVLRDEPGVHHRGGREFRALHIERAVGGDGRGPGRGARHVAVMRLEQRRLRVRAGHPGRQVEPERAFLGDADVLADEPGGMRGHGQRVRPLGRRNGDGKEHLARVGVGHQRPFGHAPRRGPVDAGLVRAGRQVERDLRRDSCVAGVAPVCMPPVRELQAQRDPEGRSALDRVGIGDQRRHRPRRGDGCALERARGVEAEEQEEEREEPGEGKEARTSRRPRVAGALRSSRVAGASRCPRVAGALRRPRVAAVLRCPRVAGALRRPRVMTALVAAIHDFAASGTANRGWPACAGHDTGRGRGREGGHGTVTILCRRKGDPHRLSAACHAGGSIWSIAPERARPSPLPRRSPPAPRLPPPPPPSRLPAPPHPPPRHAPPEPRQPGA